MAIKENRFATRLLYAFSIAFVATGIVLIGWSMVHKEPMMAVAGVADGALFWPAVRSADKTRRSNIMLRTLEIPLNRTQTAKEAAEMLQRVFEAHVGEGPRNAAIPEGNGGK